MDDSASSAANLSPRSTIVWATVAVASFHLAYEIPTLSCLIAAYVCAVNQLTRIGSARAAFGVAFVVGLLVFGPQLAFMFGVFGPFAMVLWSIGAFWTGCFVVLGRAATRAFGLRWAIVLIPLLWIGLECFRSEVYALHR